MAKFAAAAAIAVAVVAIVVSGGFVILESSSPVISYSSDAWLHECVEWDGEGNRFLVSTFFSGGVVEVPPDGASRAARVVIARGGDVEGMVSVGMSVDSERKRLLVLYADPPPRLRRAAVAAYDLRSWEKIFLTWLQGPEDDEPCFADDVAVDLDGNAYITDAIGNKIWKLGADARLLSTIKNTTFTQSDRRLDNLVGLNGIVHHSSGGYLLAIHTSGGHLFKIDIKTEEVRLVTVEGSLKRADGLALLSPTKLVAAGTPTRMVESADDWETARVVGRFVGPVHRLPASATVRDGRAFVSHLLGFGLAKKQHIIAEAAFSPLEPSPTAE